jgi:DNA mismatch repair protein MutS
MKEKFDSLKNNYPNMVFLFHVGNYYEAYYEDARTAAHSVGLIMTKKDKVQTATIPQTMKRKCISRLTKQHYSVGIFNGTIDEVLFPSEMLIPVRERK